MGLVFRGMKCRCYGPGGLFLALNSKGSTFGVQAILSRGFIEICDGLKAARFRRFATRRSALDDSAALGHSRAFREFSVVSGFGGSRVQSFGLSLNGRSPNWMKSTCQNTVAVFGSMPG